MKIIRTLFFLAVILFMINACSKQPHGSAQSIGASMDRIRKDTELSAKLAGTIEQFSEINPDYNPSWVAKLNLSEQEVLILENELRAKEPRSFVKRGALSEATSWWTPVKTSVGFQYFTSHNAPVVVMLSLEGKGGNVFIEWSSP